MEARKSKKRIWCFLIAFPTRWAGALSHVFFPLSLRVCVPMCVPPSTSVGGWVCYIGAARPEWELMVLLWSQSALTATHLRVPETDGKATSPSINTCRNAGRWAAVHILYSCSVHISSIAVHLSFQELKIPGRVPERQAEISG